MSNFNHYAKIKRILAEAMPGWYVLRIDRPTSTKNFRGETVYYDHYYRIYTAEGIPIKYCKFQKLDKLAHILRVPAETIIRSSAPSDDTTSIM